MANAFTKAQFMEPPTFGGQDPVPVGAVKAGSGIEILPDGTLNVTQGGGTINDIVCTNGIQGGGSNPQVFIGLLPPSGTTLGGVYTVDGSGVSIDQNGLIRSVSNFLLSAGTGLSVSNVTPVSATVSLNKAGTSPTAIGGIFVNPALAPGVQVSADGGLSLTPPQGTGIGGVKAGSGCTIDPVTGVLNATGTGGTITAVGAGTGLGGGGIIGSVTLFLRPPSGTTIGGVYAGDNVIIAQDGRISVNADAGVQTVSGNLPIVVGGTAADPVISVNAATQTDAGVVQLSNDPSTPNVNTAATSTAVYSVYATAQGALQRSGGEMTGGIDFGPGQTFPGTIPSSAFTQKGQLLVGTAAGQYINISAGAPGQVLSTDMASGISGLKWITAGTGTVTEVTGDAPIQVATGTSTPVISITAATTTDPGAVQLENSITSISETTAPTSLALSLVNTKAEAALPKAGGTMTGAITFNAGQTFPGTLPLAGGTMTGDITFNAGQTFPGVLADGSIGATDPINVGGTPTNPIISVDIATALALGVVQPDGTTITVDVNGVISSTGGMTNPMTTIGDIIYSQSTGTPGTPARLGAGANNTILAVNAGMPAWRSSTQLGLLTTAAAATTYAPLDNPTFTGPVTVNAGGGAGANALVVSGGNLVLATSYTPPSSSSTGSIGELAWDSDFLYFCYAPNTWGRVAVDLTPF